MEDDQYHSVIEEVGNDDTILEDMNNTRTSNVEANSDTNVTPKSVEIDPVAPSPDGNNPYPVHAIFSPGGSSEEWICKVEPEFTPTLGKRFTSLDEAIQFYRTYALSCGFTVRLYTAKTLRGGGLHQKSLVCNRQGFRERKIVNTIPPTKHRHPKRNKISRVGCPAKMRVLNDGGVFVVDQFHEGHNHTLIPMQNREFQKLSRKLTLFHKQTIVDHCRMNIGPTKTYRICKEYAKGYMNVGASLLDFKNFQRDIKCFIGNKDAQMLIDNFRKLSVTNEGFYFAYDVDKDQNLSRIFWADAQARKNYLRFGDSVSYDPTYGTNKYCMVFSPFTGVDHHKSSVTFAGALLSNEEEQSFKWVFAKFLEAMNNKEPKCIITDQDPAIKSAVRDVFKEARHKFCMWHIMQKVSEKVGPSISHDSDFLSRLSLIVWDPDLEPSEFEHNWSELVAEFGLETHPWLSYMFEIRKSWIPAYYRDLPMGSILRTTQRSESSNSFFKRFENNYGTLVEFWMRFQSAMDQQRYSQKRLDMDSDHFSPVLATPLLLEAHASKVYTQTIFYEFSDEAKASICSLGIEQLIKNNDGQEAIDLHDASRGKIFHVEYTGATNEAQCSCKLFERKGLLCSHIIWVFSGRRIQCIPDHYILPRWTRNAYKTRIYDVDGKLVEDYDLTDVRNLEMSKLWSEFYATISVLAPMSESNIRDLTRILKQFKEKINPQSHPLTKDQEIEMLIGFTAPSDISILPPIQSKNKGRAKRCLSTREKCIAKAKKPKRLCTNCKQMTNHNKRTCPNPFVEHAPDGSEDNIEHEPSEDNEVA